MASVGELDDHGADLAVSIGDDYVATVEIRRPPNNFFDITLIEALADAYERLDEDPDCRAILLCAQGKHFCAGADHSNQWVAEGRNATSDRRDPNRHIFDEAVRLFRTRKPVVAAVQGAAVGGGLGLALSADFRVAAPEARFSANFTLLGSHPGFGLTATLPALVGQQRAEEVLLLGTRVKGDEALGMGLCDRLVALEDVRDTARAFAAALAGAAPLAVMATRATLRAKLVNSIEEVLRRERKAQDRLTPTRDRGEGIQAMAQRRPPVFIGE
jgi:enoyl-CoA hydratase/carnithine racemase